TQAVPRVTAFGKTTGHANDNRRRKFIGGPPTDSAAVVELFRSRIGILTKLNFRHGHQPVIGQAHGPAYNAFFGKAGIKYAGFTVLALETHSNGMHSSLGSHIFTKYQQFGIGLKLIIQRFSDTFHNVDALLTGIRRFRAIWERMSGGGQS